MIIYKKNCFIMIQLYLKYLLKERKNMFVAFF
jgi:hypothetical protein